MLRRAARSLARKPGYTVAAVLTLGLGMGATGSIFTLLQRVVLDPLPYPESERLVRLTNPVPGVGKDERWNMASVQYFYYKAHAPSIAEIGAYQQGGVNVATDGTPQRAHAAIVNASMLRLIGARAVQGRLLGESDDVPNAADVAVISNGFWRSQFGSDPSIVGKTIRLNDQPTTVIGVMARGVELPPERGEAIASRTDVWLPIRLNPAGPFYNSHVIPMIARLANGVSAERAQREIGQLRNQLAVDYPNVYSQKFFDRYGWHTEVSPLKEYVLGDMARNLWILFGAVALVLVIACANVASLFLVRLESRRREFALRAALGAGSGDVAKEAFAEGLTLALAGAAVAAILSLTSANWLVAVSPPGIPRLDSISMDWQVLAFIVAVGVVIAGVLAGVPWAQYRGLTAYRSLGEGGRSATVGVERQRVRGVLVATQMALAFMLVVGSGLLLQSFRRLRAVNPGVDPEGVLTLQWYLPEQRYDSLTKVWQFHDAVLSKIRAIPGVVAAGVSEGLPFVTGYGCTVQGFDEPAVFDRLKEKGLTTCAGQVTASPGYFEALRIPLISGRYPTREDNDAPERGAVVVSKAFADRFWPGENAIGKGVNPNGHTRPPFYHVVGVVGDVHGSSLDEPPAIAIYYPMVALPGGGRWYPSDMHLVVKTARGDPLALVPAIRRALSEVDPTIPIANADAMQTVVSRSMGRLTFTMMLLGIAGGVALALAAIGLYGLISYVVARRTNEIGVRLALGAQSGQVERLVVGSALKLAAAGLAVGVVGAMLTSRVLRGLLYGVAPWDPVSYTSALLVLVVIAALAGWIPARRASRVDPAVALRVE